MLASARAKAMTAVGILMKFPAFSRVPRAATMAGRTEGEKSAMLTDLPHGARIQRRTRCVPSPSLRLDAGLADDRAPFVEFSLQIGRVRRRRMLLGRRNLQTHVGDPLGDRGVRHRGPERGD